MMDQSLRGLAVLVGFYSREAEQQWLCSTGWSLFQRSGTAMALERFENFSEEALEGRNNDRAEEERVE